MQVISGDRIWTSDNEGGTVIVRGRADREGVSNEEAPSTTDSMTLPSAKGWKEACVLLEPSVLLLLRTKGIEAESNGEGPWSLGETSWDTILLSPCAA